MIMIPSAHQHVSYALNYYSDEAQPLDKLLTSCKDLYAGFKGDGDFEAS